VHSTHVQAIVDRSWAQGFTHAGDESGVIALRSGAPKKLPVNDGEIKRVSAGQRKKVSPTRPLQSDESGNEKTGK
jgi:hypothetical protein